MRASFSIDSLHELEITGDVPRHEHDPASVCLNVLRTPLPVKNVYGPKEAGPEYTQGPTETIISVSLRPSHARAIASAMLSAATEARG